MGTRGRGYIPRVFRGTSLCLISFHSGPRTKSTFWGDCSPERASDLSEATQQYPSSHALVFSMMLFFFFFERGGALDPPGLMSALHRSVEWGWGTGVSKETFGLVFWVSADMGVPLPLDPT